MILLRPLAVISLALLSAALVRAATAPFARFPVGARAPALGGGVTAADHDPTAILANPAGLARLPAPFSIAFDGGLLPLQQRLVFLGAAGWVMPEMVVGAAALYHSPGGEIEFRRGPSQAPDSVETALSQMYTLAMGGRMFPALEFGVSFKLLLETIGPLSALGFGGDAGLTYEPYRRVFLSLVGRDILGTVHDWDSGGSEPFRSSYTIGTALDLNPLLLVAEYRGWNEAAAYREYGAGLEWNVHRTAIARVGVDDGRLTAGFGIVTRYRKNVDVRMDYALAGGRIDESAYEHRVALTFGYRIYDWPMDQLLFPTQEAGTPGRPRNRPEPLFKIF